MFHIYSIFTNPSWDLRCMEKDFILFIKWTLSHSRMVCFSLSERCEIFTRPNFHTSGFSQRALWHLSPTSEPCSVLVAWLDLNTSISFFKQRLPNIQLHLSDSAGVKDKDLDSLSQCFTYNLPKPPTDKQVLPKGTQGIHTAAQTCTSDTGSNTKAASGTIRRQDA